MTLGFALGWNSYEMYLLSVLVLNQFLITVIAFVRSYFGGFLLFKTDAIIGVLDRLLLIILCGAVLYFPLMDQPMSIELFIWIQTLCYGVTLIVAMILLFLRLGMPKLRFHRPVSWAIVRQSLPYALLILLMMIYSRVDSVMIERMHPNGKTEAGYYAQGFRLLSAFFMFAMLFSNLLLPMFSKMFKERQHILSLLMIATRLLLGPAIIVAIISQFNSKFILELIYISDVKESIASFQLLMWSFIGSCSTVIFGTLLTAKGELRFLNISSAIGLVVNFAINYALIPKYGANGAALATLITQSAISIAQIVYCYAHFQMRFSFATTAQFILFPLSFLLLCYFFPAHSLLHFGGLLLIGCALLFLFRLIDLKEIRSLMKA
jgi:O-antigen/teichoic acid export membrane protein